MPGSAGGGAHPAFVVGLSYFPLRYRGRLPEDDPLIQEVYSLEHCGRSAEASELESWLRIQTTMSGLIPEPLERG